MSDTIIYNSPDYQLSTLSNGLRCITKRSPGVTYCGLVVNTGSRNDPRDAHGLAHFVEHTIFKGTTTRRSSQIANRLESIGGELNAYTAKGETVVYAVTPQGYTSRALELLADITINSVFPKRELDLEREVILDEINMYLDNPSERIFDEFDDLIYAGTPLGHNILGTPESVRAIGAEECLDFLHRGYTAHRAVLYCVSNDAPERVKRMAERYFGSMSSGTPLEAAPELPLPAHFEEDRRQGGYQAHTIMGCRIFNRYDERRHALFLLNNILGGPGMNSVFSRELRDKRGYVYTVDSNVALMSDCGTWQVYFGCDRKDVHPCRRIIERELTIRADKLMTSSQLERAKRQYLGQLQVSAEHRESRAMSLGKSLLYFNKVIDIDYLSDAIRNLSADDIRGVAELICNKGLSRLTIS